MPVAGDHVAGLAGNDVLLVRGHDQYRHDAVRPRDGERVLRIGVGIDPDVIVVAPCGYSLAQTLDEAPTLAAIDGWEELNAVWDARVFLTDGSQFFNRPGPRLAEAVEIIADIVHGAGRRGASRGKHWIRI